MYFFQKVISRLAIKCLRNNGIAALLFFKRVSKQFIPFLHVQELRVKSYENFHCPNGITIINMQ